MFLGFSSCGLLVAQDVPVPIASIHCPHDGNWYDEDGYFQKCRPLSPSKPVGLSPFQRMQLQMFQAMLRLFFNKLFDFSSLFAPSVPSGGGQAAKKPQPKEYAALKLWQGFLKEAEEQAKKEAALKEAEGRELLEKVRIGGFSARRWGSGLRRFVSFTGTFCPSWIRPKAS